MSAPPDTSAPYTDSFIIQCDRNSSLEADTGNNENPAIFTNKQGTGLRLNAGDKVSVHSAFINEIGNTDGTIEFKGQSVKNSKGEEINYELEETIDDLTIPFPLDDLYSENTDLPWNPSGSGVDLDVQWNYGQMTGQNKKQILQPYGFQRCDSSNVKRTFPMKDNEMNIQVGYYKTCNGENYMHLPRRFDCFDGKEFGVEKAVGGVATKRLSARFPPDDDTLPWAYKGMQWSQCPGTQGDGQNEIGFQDGGWNGQPTMDIRVQSQVKDDWCFQDKGRRWKCEGLTSGNDGAGFGIADRTLNVLGTTKRFRWKNDNSRYQIFKKERTFFTTAPQFTEFLTADQLGASIKPDNLSGSKTNDFLGYLATGVAEAEGHTNVPTDATKTPRYWNVRDPACTSNWVPYYEIKTIEVEKGFKSPEDVADEVSASLNKTGEPKEIYARTGARTGTIPKSGVLGASHQLVGLKKDGEIFKSFYSTNHAHFNNGACKEYFVDSNVGTLAEMPEKDVGCTRYMSAYHYIGVKRPQLWISGRAFCEDALDVKAEAGSTWGEIEEFSLHTSRPAISWAGRTNPICTNIPWSKRHLLNKFIQSQGEYPELFNYGYSNIKNGDSDYGDDDNVSPEDFQMGNKTTGETYARFIHFQLTKKHSNSWKDQAGKYKSGSRRLGCDNYDMQASSDYDQIITGAETYTGYKMQAGVVPPVAVADGTTADLQGQLPYYDLSSIPLWFYYDQTRADFDGGGEDLAVAKTELCYGCMCRYNSFKEGDGGSDEDFIAFQTAPIGGLPDHFFQKEGNPTEDLSTTLDDQNYLGVDRHFNAYGTKVIMPYSGYLNGTQPHTYAAQQDQTDFYYTAQPGANSVPAGWKPDATNCKLEQTYQYALHTYIGSNGLSLNYDNDKLKRFNWQGLHTPEYIGNNFNAGSDATDPKIDDASTQVYKINKRLSGSDYCPEMQPYHTDITTSDKDANGTEIGISATNWNLEQWSAIFDAHSGITFNEFGGTADNKKYWHKTLWGLLGFSYEQFNYKYPTSGTEMNVKDRLSFNSRINPDNQGETPMILTNTLVKSSDVSLYRNNIYGSGMFNDQGLSYGSIWHGGLEQKGKVKSTEKDFYLNNPAISITSFSVGIKADRQPTKMLRPYYLIKSNIVGDMKYLGAGHSTEGGQMLPIIGVVNKENGFGDYYFQTANEIQFTITQPTTLSEVTTSIHDPDMTSARVDKNSCVLYLVQKQNSTNLNVVQTLLQENQLNPAELEPPSMNDAEYNEYFKQFIMNPKQQAELNQENVFAHYPPYQQEQVPDGEHGATIGGFIPPPRRVESFLGLRAGESPARVINPSMPEPGSGKRLEPRSGGKMTRKEAKGLRQFQAERERAAVGLRRRFAPEGERAEPYPARRERLETTTSVGSGRSGGTSGTDPSSVITAPSEPRLTPRTPTEKRDLPTRPDRS